jgi:hypothetical protein
MKTINQIIITVFLIALMTNQVFGYPGYGGNNSSAAAGNITQNGQETIDLVNTTQSDQNIEISSHLIEVDADRYEAQNKLYVREMIVFRNSGDKIFSGALKTWVTDGLEEIQIMKTQMMAETEAQPILTEKNGNIISWQDRIDANNVQMYVLEYLLSVEPTGSISKSKYFSKKLLFPTLINYNYIPSPGYPVLLLNISRSSGSSITLLDENRNKIIAEDVTEGKGSILIRFSEVNFKELNIEFSKSAIDLSQIAIYLFIGLLIVLVLSYPVIRKKIPQQEKPAPEDEDLSEKTTVELDAEQRELVSRLDELEKDYASGNLIDEEYEELRDSYKKKLKNINRKIE